MWHTLILTEPYNNAIAVANHDITILRERLHTVPAPHIFFHKVEEKSTNWPDKPYLTLFSEDERLRATDHIMSI